MNDNRQPSYGGDAAPTRHKSDLADLVELLLDKGIVVNADIVVTVGDTELLGVYVRAAIASFETAAKYGLDFPEGTDMDRVREAAGVEPLEDEPGEQAKLNELDVGVAQVDERDVAGEDGGDASDEAPVEEPAPAGESDSDES